MNVALLLEKRRVQWAELERLCDQMELSVRSGASSQQVARFATLYRAACADLALAGAYQLPPGTVTYLHRLVARAHNQLYRSEKLNPGVWVDVLLHEAPQRIFADPCVRVSTVLFFGLFSLSMFLGVNETMFPDFAEQVVGAEQLEQMEESFSRPLNGSLDHYLPMAAFYIMHNTGIGLTCFAYGILLIPCLFTLCFNAVVLGASFGYMARPGIDSGDNFFEFVTAHGPFELSAIALSAGAGLRLGLGLFQTGGLSRIASLRRNARLAVPIISAAAALFFLAAMTEGFLSPSPLPYTLKAAWAILSSGVLMFYFVVLGFPRAGNITDAA